MGIKRGAKAVDQVRKLLGDNAKVQKLLDFLEEEDKKYKKAHFSESLVFVLVITPSPVLAFSSCNMLKGGLVFECLFFMLAYFLISFNFLLCSLRRKELYININKYSELKFINQLLSEYKAEEVVLENLPLFKAAENYYVSLPDGMQRVLPEDMPYGENTKMQEKEYHYRQLCWKHQGFYLQDITDVEVCSMK